MARIARVVVSGYPHHVTQRGSRRQPTFFSESDYQQYLLLMNKWCQHHNVSIWAYCLMPNHVHLVAVPKEAIGLSRAVGRAHLVYARRINAREGWTGHLWQERFSSFVMDETYLLATVRYVEMNPVRAGLVDAPEDYPWSSARAHFEGRDDVLVAVSPMLERIGDWRDYLAAYRVDDEELVRRHTRTGRPLGCKQFIAGLEKMLQRKLTPSKKGRKKKR